MCEGGIKTNLRRQEFYRAGTAPPGFEIPGSATDIQCIHFIMILFGHALWRDTYKYLCIYIEIEK